jgi:hypothetical protein
MLICLYQLDELSLCHPVAAPRSEEPLRLAAGIRAFFLAVHEDGLPSILVSADWMDASGARHA